MPIIVDNIDWSQTENTVTIKVPIKGIQPAKTDIFYSERYIKASYENYFFEVFLFAEIIPERSNCTIQTKMYILFELIKCEAVMWEHLELKISKSEKQKLKMQYIEERHRKLQNESNEVQNQKSELKRLAVREQMALDSKQREEIQEVKETEKNLILNQMELLKSSDHKKKPKFVTPKSEIKSDLIPPLRTSKTVNVMFTPREFPTPCRESKLEEENEWLRKQSEARRSVGFISEDLRPEEHNPQFLKAKGDEFFRSKNFLGAISAYSFGIKLNDKFSDLYVGRGQTHLALGNYNKAIQDCSKALDLMKPEVESNLKERAACIGWRGIGLINLGLLQKGIDEIKCSLRLLPNEVFSEKLDAAIEQLNENVDETV